MDGRKSTKKKRRKVEQFLKTKLDECSENEFLVIRNPNSKRIVHIMDSYNESVCGQYNVSGTGLFLLERNMDCIEVWSKEKIKNELATCKNCADRL